MSKKKILFLITNLNGGGAEKVLVNLLNRLNPEKFDITLRALVYGGTNLKNLHSNVHYQYVFPDSFPGLGKLDYLPRWIVYPLIAHGSYDIIIVYLHGVLTKIVSYAPKEQKTVAFLHANMEKSPFMRDLQERGKISSVFDSYNKIVAVSKDIKESFLRMGGASEKLQVIYNTFDIEEIYTKATEQINQDGNEDKIRLCCIGKLAPVKGFMRLLEVFNQLVYEGKNIYLTIIGEGEERKNLEKYIQEKHLEQNVCLVGYESNPYKYLSKSDLFVCSSFTEGFSSVVAESIILGIPVLTTDCAGMKEILGENNEYGVIVANDKLSLYMGLHDLLDHPDKIRYYQERAKERSKSFAPLKSVKAVEDLLGNL